MWSGSITKVERIQLSSWYDGPADYMCTNIQTNKLATIKTSEFSESMVSVMKPHLLFNSIYRNRIFCYCSRYQLYTLKKYFHVL